MAYDYPGHVAQDVLDWMRFNAGLLPGMLDAAGGPRGFARALEDTIRAEGDVTGRAENTYTYDRVEARAFTRGNDRLLRAAVRQGVTTGTHLNFLVAGAGNWEAVDVICRETVLHDAVLRALRTPQARHIITLARQTAGRAGTKERTRS